MRYGLEAATLAGDLRDLVQARLQQESPYAGLWLQFEAAPRGHQAEVTGALEALMDADPALVRRLDGLLAAFNQATAPPTQARTGSGQQDLVAGEEIPPDMTPPGERSRTGDFARGAYLYGDTYETLERVSTERGEARPLRGMDQASIPDATTLTGLFAQLRQAITEHEGLDGAAKAELTAAVGELNMLLTRGDPVDLDLLAQRLSRIRARSPEIADLLLTGLAGDPEERRSPEGRTMH